MSTSYPMSRRPSHTQPESAPTAAGPLLQVTDLSVRFSTPEGDITAVDGLNFSLHQGETLGIVGESGSGKSQTAFALMGLLAANGKVSGSAYFAGQNILNMPESQMNRLRAQEIAMILSESK